MESPVTGIYSPSELSPNGKLSALTSFVNPASSFARNSDLTRVDDRRPSGLRRGIAHIIAECPDPEHHEDWDSGAVWRLLPFYVAPFAFVIDCRDAADEAAWRV